VTAAAEFVRDLVKEVLPRPVFRLGRRVKRYLYGYGWRMPAPLAALPPGASPALQLAYRAWQIAGPAEVDQRCYYSLDFEGFHLPGERPWERRWAQLRQATAWRGSRVLELGCNLGLLGIFALRAGAEDALGVDFIAPLLEANRLVQQAYGVSYRTVQLDFDDARPWEEELSAFQPTLVTALSVLEWVKDKERFLDFLGRFDAVLFEGHDNAAVERQRLGRVGFTDIVLLARSEHNRPILLARR
jgi:SAM-dependent methyltransferase